MIKVEIINTKMFRHLIKCVNHIVGSDLPIQFFESGMRFGYMSPSHVRMVSIIIQKEFFKSYELNFEDDEQQNDESSFFINVDDFDKILGKMTKSERLFLIRNTKDPNIAQKLIIENLKGERLQRISLNLVTPDSEMNADDAITSFHEGIERLDKMFAEECPIDIEIKGAELITTLDLFNVSNTECAEFKTTEKKIQIESTSAIADLYDEIYYDKIHKISEFEHSAFYSIQMLSDIVKDCFLLSKTIKFNFKANIPVMIIPILPEKEAQLIQIEYFVAPRIDDDDDGELYGDD